MSVVTHSARRVWELCDDGGLVSVTVVAETGKLIELHGKHNGNDVVLRIDPTEVEALREILAEALLPPVGSSEDSPF